MDKEAIIVLSQEEIEFLELIAEVIRAAAELPIPAIYPRHNVDESSNTLSSDGVNVNCHPTVSVCLESKSEARKKAELIPIPRQVENVTVLKLYTKSLIHVEILIPEITFHNIRTMQSNNDLFGEMPITARTAHIRTTLRFSMTVLFPWNVANKRSTSLFVGEITESHLPIIPLCLGNAMQLANALRASAIRNALKLPMTVTFLRRNTEILSTSFFGASSTAQIRVLDCESSILGEMEPSIPPTEIIIERNPEFCNSYEPTDEALESQQSLCKSTLKVIVSDNTESEDNEIETVAEIKAAEEPEDRTVAEIKAAEESEEQTVAEIKATEESEERTVAEIKAAEESEERTNIQRKSVLKRLGRRLLKIGRRLCCCYCSKLD